jgi:hypothetical protein
MTTNLPAPSTGWSTLTSLIQGSTAVPKAVAKLIDTVGDQIGLFLEATHIRRKAKADADAALIAAKGKAEEAVVKVESKYALKDIQHRAEERVRRREAARQENLEAITAQAAKELPESVSDKPVDPDWVAQFLNHSQDVSNDQMRTVWARILAGEVANPGSFSLQALALVRIMGKGDAELFTRFCTALWCLGDKLAPIIPHLRRAGPLVGVNLGFSDFAHLESLGLIKFHGGGFSTSFDRDGPIVVSYFGRPHTLVNQDTRELETGTALLTEAGRELAAIAGATPNEDYRAWVVSCLRQEGWEVAEG